MNSARIATARAATMKTFLTGAPRVEPLPRMAYRRRYATGAGGQGSPAPAKNWLMLSILLGVPISIFLWQRQSPKQGQEDTQSSRDHDKPRSRGEPGGTGSISFKQEGLSNADTSNPYVNEPGKSTKGEGETDSAKVKGTVKPERPQV